MGTCVYLCKHARLDAHAYAELYCANVMSPNVFYVLIIHMYAYLINDFWFLFYPIGVGYYWPFKNSLSWVNKYNHTHTIALTLRGIL